MGDGHEELLYHEPFTRTLVLVGDVVLWSRRGNWGLGVVAARHLEHAHRPVTWWAVDVQVGNSQRCTTKYFLDSQLTTLGPLDDGSPEGLALRQDADVRLDTIAKLRWGKLSKLGQSRLADELERAFAQHPYSLGPHCGVHDAVADLAEALNGTVQELDARKQELDELEAAAKLLADELVALAPLTSTGSRFRAELRELLNGHFMADRKSIVDAVLDLAKKHAEEG